MYIRWHQVRYSLKNFVVTFKSLANLSEREKHYISIKLINYWNWLWFQCKNRVSLGIFLECAVDADFKVWKRAARQQKGRKRTDGGHMITCWFTEDHYAFSQIFSNLERPELTHSISTYHMICLNKLLTKLPLSFSTCSRIASNSLIHVWRQTECPEMESHSSSKSDRLWSNRSCNKPGIFFLR